MIICGVELCERLGFYTFNGTQAFFLEHLGYPLSVAGAINSSMVTLCMAWTLFAGWIADAYLGRYWTILVFGNIYALGSCSAAAAAWPPRENGNFYLFSLMVLVPLGTAGIKANISNFGADQFDVSTPEGKAAQESFFSWFYVSINIGSGVAYGFLTTFATSGGLGVPRAYGYFAVYVVAAIAMLFGVFLFSLGKPYYIIRQVRGGSSSLAICMRHVMESAKGGSLKGAGTLVGIISVIAGLMLSVISSVSAEGPHAQALTYAAAAISALAIILLICCNLETDWVDNRALREESIPSRDVADYFRIMPVSLTGQLAFGALYNAMQFWYQHQACQMDLRMFPGRSNQVAGSFFSIADCAAIILCTPLLLGFVHPAIERWTGSKMSIGFKFSIGIALGCLSVLVATRLEYSRRLAPKTTTLSNCAPPGVMMSSIPAAWMLVPYFLTGLMEIYCNVTLMYFAYNQSPVSMRTLSATANLFLMGVTTAVFSILGLLLKEYLPDDLDDGHLEYGYYASALIGLFFLGLFYLSLMRFQSKEFD
jgi:peptide/histidine transporter 3/4